MPREDSDMGIVAGKKRKTNKSEKEMIKKIASFYRNGFKNMPSWGKKLWLIILIKLFIMFAVLKIFFFPDFLNTKFDNDEQKSDYVKEQLINKK
jgi:hypothetical protein